MVKENRKVVEMGKTQGLVRITHAKKDLVYFMENMLGWKLQSFHKDFIKKLEKKDG